jgi:hypothetical protein
MSAECRRIDPDTTTGPKCGCQGDSCALVAPRLGETVPKFREDDVERCDFGGGEIARLRHSLQQSYDRQESYAKCITQMTTERKVLREALERIAYPGHHPETLTKWFNFRAWASSVAANALSFGHSSYVPPKEDQNVADAESV